MGKNSPATPPLPRPARQHIVGFAIPFQQLRHHTHYFERVLREVREVLQSNAPLDYSNPLYDAALNWDAYALAVQVFACMTVDAQLNTYGLVRFGRPAFNRRFRTWGAAVRLKLMMEWGSCIKLDDTDDLIRTLKSLFDKRNPIVHMQSREDVYDATGRVARPAPPPADSVAGAEAAINEMERFLGGFAALIGKHDIESWTYIAPL